MTAIGTIIRRAGAAAAAAGMAFTAAHAAEPIKVGVLHSLSGTMAISETTLKELKARWTPTRCPFFTLTEYR